VASAFAVPRRAVTLITGATSRTKIVEVAGATKETLDRLRCEHDHRATADGPAR
jgi:uncharacterized protein YggU (UPF0235/DUF167 family)